MDKTYKEIISYFSDLYKDITVEHNDGNLRVEYLDVELQFTAEPNFYMISVVDYSNPDMMLIYSFHDYNEFITKFNLNLNWEDFSDESIGEF